MRMYDWTVTSKATYTIWLDEDTHTYILDGTLNGTRFTVPVIPERYAEAQGFIHLENKLPDWLLPAQEAFMDGYGMYMTHNGGCRYLILNATALLGYDYAKACHPELERK